MQLFFDWTVSYSAAKDGTRLNKIPATVPGAVQLDYAKANNYAPYNYGLNFKQFDWMEDVFFFYETQLDFSLEKDQTARLCFDGIDYGFDILLNEKCVYSGEGAFTPIKLDVSEYSDKKTTLTVVIHPIPKRMPEPKKRDQASACCKPPSSYSWDWHPRLVPSGIWKDAYLDITTKCVPRDMEVTYRLSDDFSYATVNIDAKVFGKGNIRAEIISPEGNVILSNEKEAFDSVSFTFKLENPSLWFPRGYGEQPLYRVRLSGDEAIDKKIGFRRSRLIPNDNRPTRYPFPKGSLYYAAQLEINGKKVFAKGSNWVNPEIFPCLITNKRYDELIQLAYDANMNILRVWGGQYIPHDHFFEKCDELGIMVWQEFMLSCNSYPDTDEYLSVLKQEAISIIKAIRSHPSLVLWCGGNELFNGYGDMSPQTHALRLLNNLCYELDRFTPFNMTSPMFGVCHGGYTNVIFPDARFNNYIDGYEFITAVKTSNAAAYTEFGCCGASDKEYILKNIMGVDDYNDCNYTNEVWSAHHAFGAAGEHYWLGKPDINYFFGYVPEQTDLILENSIYIQNMCYKSVFEEMRRQQPLCSMVLNWDFNEPWPSAAGNNLVSYPAIAKSALWSVKDALRPSLFSLETEHNRYLTDEEMHGKIWFLNDSDEQFGELCADVLLAYDNTETKLCSVKITPENARSNFEGDSFTLKITSEIPERFSIRVICKENPKFNSTYSFVHRKK